MHLLQLPDDPGVMIELQSSVFSHLKRLHENMIEIDRRNQEQYSDDDLTLFVNIFSRYTKTLNLWTHIMKHSPKTNMYSSFTPEEHFSG
jgi:hypothetical protein